MRRLGAALLRDVNVVDTPGTNVILERQQRLTEEYVPRADLVLFVMSADRPFTESEVDFLKYIRCGSAHQQPPAGFSSCLSCRGRTSGSCTVPESRTHTETCAMPLVQSWVCCALQEVGQEGGLSREQGTAFCERLAYVCGKCCSSMRQDICCD